jgi:hypothetical protein
MSQKSPDPTGGTSVDESRCARIVWTITKDFSAETGASQALVLLRNALAQAVLATDGEGFPAPVEVDRAQLQTPAWKGCVAAAIKAKESPTTDLRYLVLWPEGDPGRPAETVPVHWARQGAATPGPKGAIGPVLNGSNSRVWLFAYDSIDTQCALEQDGDAGPGLFPRQASAAAGSRGVIARAPGGWGWVLFVAAIVLGTTTMAWVYGAAELVHGAADRLLEGVSFMRSPGEGEGTLGIRRNGEAVDKLLTQARVQSQEIRTGLEQAREQLGQATRAAPPSADVPPAAVGAQAEPQGAGPQGPGSGDMERLRKQVLDLQTRMDAQSGEVRVLECLAQLQARLNGVRGELGTGYCEHALREAWVHSGAEIAKRADTRAAWLEWLWRASDVRGQISLLLPLALSALAILLLIISAGIAMKATPAGAIIDERNRVSLSRLQQLCWTVVLFGGFTILGIFNTALLADFARDLGQVQALVDATRSDQAVAGVFSLFPSMDPTLWAVLGIAVAISPYLSVRILSEKVLPPGAHADARTLQVRADPLDQRNAPSAARWADLFAGEGKGGANHVDVSRLQHLVITTLLLGGYIVLLVEYVRTLDATAILMAIMTGAPVFAAMPPVDATFVGLLALSHAGYLAFKAIPSAPTTA